MDLGQRLALGQVPLGQRVQAAYRRHFLHRYGGHAPSWHGISAAERALWAEVELEVAGELAARWSDRDQTPSH